MVREKARFANRNRIQRLHRFNAIRVHLVATFFGPFSPGLLGRNYFQKLPKGCVRLPIYPIRLKQGV
jgi:hypothetical protein